MFIAINHHHHSLFWNLKINLLVVVSLCLFLFGICFFCFCEHQHIKSDIV